MGIIAKKRNILLLFIVLGLFFIFSYASALQTNWPLSPTGTSLDKDSTLPVLIKYFYEWGIALAGLAAFIALIIAGFQYLTSMGDPTQMKGAFDRIRSAFLGIILLLSSLLILNTINPDLTSLKMAPFNPGDIPEIEIPDMEGFDEPTECDKIEVNYTGEGSPIILEPKNCKSVPVPGTDVQSSQGYTAGKKEDACLGSLQFYAKSNCTTEVGPRFPSTNTTLSLSEELVKGVKFIPVK